MPATINTTAAGRPVGTRFTKPQNPDRVLAVIAGRDANKSYQSIGRQLGISRVAVRLLWLRWGADPWADEARKGFTAPV